MQIGLAGHSGLVPAIHYPGGLQVEPAPDSGGLHASLEALRFHPRGGEGLRVNVQRKSTSRTLGKLSGSTAKTRSVKRRENQSLILVLQPWGQNSWPDTPPEYRPCLVEAARRDPTLTAPCRANRRGPFALSSGSSACGSPGKTRSRSLSRLLPATPLASAPARVSWVEYQMTEPRRAWAPRRARRSAGQNSWPSTESVYQTCPAEGAHRDPSLAAPCHASRRGPFALSSHSSIYGSPGKTRSQSFSRLLPAIPPPALAATAKQEPLSLDRHPEGQFHFAHDSSWARPKQRFPESTQEK